MAKSHQLPFYNSNNFLLHLYNLRTLMFGVLHYALGGGGRYYVSFIDDFSRFTWIYTIKNKYEVHCVFLEYQTHAERLLNRKILNVQSD
jgi:hypothetical protein